LKLKLPTCTALITFAYLITLRLS